MKTLDPIHMKRFVIGYLWAVSKDAEMKQTWRTIKLHVGVAYGIFRNV